MTFCTDIDLLHWEPSICRDAAFASFEESRKGTLAPGKLADFVMLDRNLFEIPPDRIREVHPVLTVVGGRQVFAASR